MDNCKNLIRVGRVSSINPAACSAKVAFEDKSKVVSHHLPILVRGSLDNKDYWMPQPNEQVICMFLPSGNAQGFILGTFYSENDLPPVTSDQKRHMAYSDGTTLEYDSNTHTLTINAVGAVNIIAAGNVHVTGDVVADGISLKHHTHGGVTTGSATTGQPA